MQQPLTSVPPRNQPLQVGDLCLIKVGRYKGQTACVSRVEPGYITVDHAGHRGAGYRPHELERLT